MKTLPQGFQAHLDSGATTLCWCWRITRRTGERLSFTDLGFTDHDCDLVFDGTTFEAATGFSATEISSSVGLGVDNLEVESALVSSRLSEASLAAGDFDEAAVEIFRVNWSNPAQRVLMRKGSLGEVRRTGAAFSAEVRGLAHYLQQPKGRLFQYSCDAELGDSRCGVDLTDPSQVGAGSIAAADSDRQFSVSGLDVYSSGWFTRGLLTVTSGTNSGRAREVKRHTVRNGAVQIELWQPLGSVPVAGDAFTITAGCDKILATCREKFGNAINYRGFPHMPGNDFLSSPSNANDTTDTTVAP